MNAQLKYEPHEKQAIFHSAPQRFKVFVGGMGSGKTLSGAAETYQIAWTWPRNTILVGRATYPELRDSTRKEFLGLEVIVDGKEYTLEHSPLVRSWKQSENSLELINGTTILFRALDDFDKIKSINLGAFWVDEVTEIPEEMWLGLVGRLRKNGVEHFGFGTTNPEGHDWVWKRFVAQADKEHFCVQSSSEDNPYLPDGYIQSLKATYPEEWIKRYVQGSFDTFSGLVYSEWKDSRPYVVPKFDIPKSWYRFIGIDHGYRNPTAVLWCAVSPAGRIFIYDEFYASGKLVSEIAEVIKAKHDRVQMHLIDPSCRNKNGVTGRSVMDEFMDCGIVTYPANNDVRAGINRVKERMKIVEGKSDLVIFSDCINLRTELQTYRWKDLKPGAVQDAPEKPVKKNDHACDALRYLVNYTYDTPVVKKEKRNGFDYFEESNDNRHWMAA